MNSHISQKRLFIPNRSEILCRIAKSARELGIETVGVYHASHEVNPFAMQFVDHMLDMDQNQVVKMDQNSNQYSSCFLNISKLIQIAKHMNCSMVHPGYGFLSENSNFAQECLENNLIWVGPSPESIRVMGSKQLSKQIIQEYNNRNQGMSIPLIPGYNGTNQSNETLLKEMKKIGLPCLIKAAAGGGGKGMRVVYKEEDFPDALESARTEALSAFGDSQLILEKYLQNVRHVEIQVIADQSGSIMHALERDCSVQRRHQKIIEESPSPIMTEKLRKKMTEVAIAIAKMINYVGVGTVEFVVDEQNNYFFLEVNTRLQVEHPVTEFVCQGELKDLVALQLRIANNYSISNIPKVERPVGYAIEVRLCAEDPFRDFLPCPGPVHFWHFYSSGSYFNSNGNMRCDTGITSSSTIPMQYDPMIAKIIAKGQDRIEAIERLKHLLRNTICFGVKTNKEYLLQILEDKTFIQGMSVTTDYLSNIHQSLLLGIERKYQSGKRYSQYALFLFESNQKESTWRHISPGWTNRFSMNSMKRYYIDITRGLELARDISILSFSCQNKDVVTCGEDTIKILRVDLIDKDLHGESCFSILVDINGISMKYAIFQRSFISNGKDKSHYFVMDYQTGINYHYEKASAIDLLSSSQITTQANYDEYKVSMPSQVLAIPITSGMNVQEGDVLMVLESMKMETKVVAWKSGVVSYKVSVSDRVQEGDVLLSITT